jgi:hypothetical protein
VCAAAVGGVVETVFGALRVWQSEPNRVCVCVCMCVRGVAVCVCLCFFSVCVLFGDGWPAGGEILCWKQEYYNSKLCIYLG